MSDQTNPADAPIIQDNTPTNKKTGPRKSKKSPTAVKADDSVTPIISEETPTDEQGENQVQKRGPLKQSELVKWTTFVRPEVKIAVQKAAKKRAITDTAWLDEKLWSAATDDLTKKAQPPMKTEDIVDLVSNLEKRLAEQQVEVSKPLTEIVVQQSQQIADLTKTVEALAKRPEPKPLTFREMLLGRKKEG